jgi:2-polyprenyl-3-methyl-5-hydroxy-6-metoxy-1,4-benzoquinol methylase
MRSSLKKHEWGFYEVSEKPSSEELQKYYANKYYQESKGTYQISYSQEEKRYFNVKLEQKLEKIKSIRGTIPGKMLDIGCGEGFALEYFRANQWTVEGLDYSDAGVKGVNPECLDFLITGDIPTLLKQKCNDLEKYDLIMLTNVLEHLLDPLGLLEQLKCLLNSNGVISITVPNDFSMLQDYLMSSKKVDADYWVVVPDHLYYFDHNSLRMTCENVGYFCHDVLADFPIDIFLLNSHANYIQNKSLGKEAHRSRVALENLLSQNPLAKINEFYSSMAKVGLGRDLTIFLGHGV